MRHLARGARGAAAAATLTLALGCGAGPQVPGVAEPEPQDQEGASASSDGQFDTQRELLVDEVASWGVTDPAVLEALRAVPRHRFVPDGYRGQAYGNHPLPIGHGQTISQPYIVGLMTEALDLADSDLVLEVGTGSGYQAAVLAELVDHVYTIEIIDDLAVQAASVLSELGYGNVTVRHGDGYQGWPEHAPFDAIIVTAAPDHVPPPLRSQLADGGRLVIPVGPVGGYQELWSVARDGDEFNTSTLGGVQFVPLTRDER